MASEPITPELLRGWPLPDRTGTKDARGSVLVVGGARATPGAALLAGLAALRVGAGRLTLAVAGSVAGPLAVAVPESGVVGLPEDANGSVSGSNDALDGQLERADAVVVGPGFDEPVGTRRLVEHLVGTLRPDVPLVLDAFSLGVLRDLPDDVRELLRGRSVLTPNLREAQFLLPGGGTAGKADEPDPAEAAAEAARRYGAVVACGGQLAAPDGRAWRSGTGASGLGTSGSGDVLAGAIAGLLAGGADPAQAACWGVWLHGSAGDRLAARVGLTGYLARELLDGLPAVLVELSTS
ncbi:NAD(P)H-hydrate dehydratase [Cellulomonas sp. SG140]|uniref:NAD(P)H-hydrate dehydratase n=1 Tax=Cellulomonas sp. SG140 TaxID=2976536 RepID=UPI0021E8DBA3|nr:NAD(P)H-hydrate dehydratase [Cellulomonas sp. SG140]